MYIITSMKIKIFLILFFFFMCFHELINADTMETCEKKIDNLHQALLENNRSEKNPKMRLKIVNDQLGNIFDYKKMIKIIYGPDWKEIKKEKKDEISNSFLKYISYNYTKRFHNITDLNFEILSSEDIKNDITVVRTNLNIKDKEPVGISYICLKKNKLIFDVLLKDSISEISTKKSEFRSTIEKGGVQGLIDAINNLINL